MSEEDIDELLMRQMRSLDVNRTENKAVKLQEITNYEITMEQSLYLLEMSDGSIPKAIGCYYDLYCDSFTLPHMEVIDPHPDEPIVVAQNFSTWQCNQPLVVCKSLILGNSGETAVPEGTRFEFVEGTEIFPLTAIPPLDPKTSFEINFMFKCNPSVGSFYSRVRICLNNGLSISDCFWIVFVVEDSSLQPSYVM